MKWIKYQIVCNEDDEILVTKKLEYNAENIAIAEEESYDGSYTVEDDGKSYTKKPLAIADGGTGATYKAGARKNLEVAQAIESNYYPNCHYRNETDSGVPCWINPPLLADNQNYYRTTERIGNKGVYKMRIDVSWRTPIAANSDYTVFESEDCVVPNGIMICGIEGVMCKNPTGSGDVVFPVDSSLSFKAIDGDDEYEQYIKLVIHNNTSDKISCSLTLSFLYV